MKRTRTWIAVFFIIGAVVFTTAVVVNNNVSDNSSLDVGDSLIIKQIFPQEGDQVLQQSSVSIQLDARYKLVRMMIHPNNDFTSAGVDVTDAARHVSGLNLWRFTPQVEERIKLLSSGTNCVTASYAPIAEPHATKQKRWCFTVL